MAVASATGCGPRQSSAGAEGLHRLVDRLLILRRADPEKILRMRWDDLTVLARGWEGVRKIHYSPGRAEWEPAGFGCGHSPPEDFLPSRWSGRRCRDRSPELQAKRWG